jgi:hypothetical protein
MQKSRTHRGFSMFLENSYFSDSLYMYLMLGL